MSNVSRWLQNAALLCTLAILLAVPAAGQTQDQAPPATNQSTQEFAGQTVQSAGARADRTAGTPRRQARLEADVEAIGNRDVGNGINFYSLEREIALGKQLAQEVERSAKLIDDPVVSEYVNRVGQNLVRNSDAKVPFTIKVIDSDEVNAFALPGGFFYVNSGLILRADSESELAGVMAHEIAHVAARHSTKRETKGQIAQLATIPLILLGPGGWAGYGIYQGLNFAIPLTFLKFSRGDENEADYPGPAIHVQDRLRSQLLRKLLREGAGRREAAAGNGAHGFQHAPSYRRTACENVQKTIATILAGARPVHHQHVGI